MQPYIVAKHPCVSKIGKHIHSCTFIMLKAAKRCEYLGICTCHQNVLLFNQGSKVGPLIGMVEKNSNFGLFGLYSKFVAIPLSLLDPP
jgi:hypothetical protein